MVASPDASGNPPRPTSSRNRTRNFADASADAPAFHFVTDWKIAARIEEAYAALINMPDYHRWWPAAFLKSTPIGGTPGAVGAQTDIVLKGMLPFTIPFRATLEQAEAPARFSFTTEGVVIGRGLYTLQQDHGSLTITFDWAANSSDPKLNRVARSPLGQIFQANHNWVQRQGGRSLILELARRAGRIDVPPPPGPAALWLARLLRQPLE